MPRERHDSIHPASRVFVAGGETLIGAAVLRRLRRAGFECLVGTPPDGPDLADARQVDAFFAEQRPEFVFLAAGQSGGIQANQLYPAELMLDNLLVACHLIEAAHRHGTRKLLYLASSCSYPRHAPQPMRVESLMTGPLEPTNECYALAKLAGLKLCEAFRAQHGAAFINAVPGNAFGPGDDFSRDHSHVIPAMIRKMHEAMVDDAPCVELWGTGRARREFIYVDDLADACLFVMRHYDDPRPINLGGGEDLSIAELAEMVRDVVGYRGELRFDRSKPDGMPLKALDSGELAALGWRPKTPFPNALAATYQWFLQHETRETLTHA